MCTGLGLYSLPRKTGHSNIISVYKNFSIPPCPKSLPFHGWLSKLQGRFLCTGKTLEQVAGHLRQEKGPGRCGVPPEALQDPRTALPLPKRPMGSWEYSVITAGGEESTGFPFEAGAHKAGSSPGKKRNTTLKVCCVLEKKKTNPKPCFSPSLVTLLNVAVS